MEKSFFKTDDVRIEGNGERFSIEFPRMTIKEWGQYLQQCPQANWMQSWAYAQASFQRDQYRTRLGLVKDGSGKVCAIFALQEIQLGPIHFMRLNRGPLWLERPQNQKEEILDLYHFIEAFQALYPKRFLRKFRWLPEIEDSPELSILLKQKGFHASGESFQTCWLDLETDAQTVFKNLHYKWRNQLRHALQADLRFEVIERPSSHQFMKFLDRYQSYQLEKGYQGPTKAFIQCEFEQAVKVGEVFLFQANDQGQPIAGMMMTASGGTINFRIAWNSQTGRKLKAHYFLLWNIVNWNTRFSRLDLGGLLPETQPGISHFKKGTGGRIFTSPGYWYY